MLYATLASILFFNVLFNQISHAGILKHPEVYELSKKNDQELFLLVNLTLKKYIGAVKYFGKRS